MHIHNWRKWETLFSENVYYGYSNTYIVIQQRECGGCGKIKLRKVRKGVDY